MKPFILSFLILLTFLGRPATASVLQEIRTGKYSDFTRLVFQFEAPVRFQVQDDERAGKFTITFMNTTSVLPENRLREFSAPIESVDIKRSGQHLVAAVALSFSRYGLKSFTLTGPDRIVLDLYPEMDSKSRVVLNEIVIKESIKTKPIEDQSGAQASGQNAGTLKQEKREKSVPPATGQPAVPLAKQEVEASAQPPEPSTMKTASSAKKQLQPVVVTPATQKKDDTVTVRPVVKTGKFQQNLITILAGISIIILALVGFLLFQKKNAAEKTAHVEAGKELKTTADIMASIDAKIKEKFKQYKESNPD